MTDRIAHVSCLFCFILVMSVPCPVPAGELPKPFPLPAFTQSDREAWINSAPLTLDELQDQVTLVYFWTYGCTNCRRSLAWLEALHNRYAEQGLRIIGIHTPEFAWEKPRAAVVAAVRLHGIQYPVMLDNDGRFWQALSNHYWPAYYLVDRQARVVGYYFGETHVHDRQALAVEAQLDKLLEAARQ